MFPSPKSQEAVPTEPALLKFTVPPAERYVVSTSEEATAVAPGSTVTTDVAVPVQPPLSPVTVYVVVVVGEAVTVAPVVPLNPVAGDQLYVLAPLAVKVALLPAHMVTLAGVTETVGTVFTVTTTVVDPEHPPVVPVTVYVVVAVGEAVTVAPVVPLKPVEGDHA